MYNTTNTPNKTYGEQVIKGECDIIQIPVEIESEMINWERWAKGRTTFRDRCRSLESRYKSTEVWTGSTVSVQIDILEAVEIERIISTYLPPKYRKAIKEWHIQRMPIQMMRRRLNDRDIRSLMTNAWLMIQNVLDKNKKCYNVGITDEPSHDEIAA